MLKIEHLKLTLTITYFTLIVIFLFFYFYFDFNQYINLTYLKENKDFFISYKNKNVFLLSFIFFIFVIVWILLQGFGTPLVIIAGFLFSTLLGSFLLITSHAIGCTFVYLIANSLFKRSIQKNYSNYYLKLKKKFNDNEFIYLIFLRVIPGIPLQTVNILPVFFNMKVKNYFLATLIGSTIPKIIYLNLTNSFFKSIENNDLNYKLLFTKEIIFAIILVIFFLLMVKIIKKYFYS